MIAPGRQLIRWKIRKNKRNGRSGEFVRNDELSFYDTFHIVLEKVGKVSRNP